MAEHSVKKPSVLIVGGLGYIGRFLARYIHTNQLASTVRIVDKALPPLRHLAPEFEECCGQSVFVQADASRENAMDRIFNHPDVPEGKWDLVFNLGGETAWSQTYEIYKLRSYQLSLTLAKEAAKRGVGAFVEASTGMVYSSNRTPRTEGDKLKPWIKLAKVKLETELELSNIAGLNLVILRLAHVYGQYDWGFIAKALCLARVYQDEDSELKWLWTEELRINTVHIEDTVRAFWTAAEWRRGNIEPSSPTITRRSSLIKGEDGPQGVPIFNIVDHSETNQGLLAKIVGEVFNIKTGFQGTIVSQFAKLNLESVVDDLNEDVLEPWAILIEKAGITRPGPLTPFLEKELLKDSELSLNGSHFEKTTGFKYEHERFTADEIREVIDSYKRMNWWP